LDCRVNLKPGVAKSELECAMKGHVSAEAELAGRFQH
jgi:hypothetical protein